MHGRDRVWVCELDGVETTKLNGESRTERKMSKKKLMEYIGSEMERIERPEQKTGWLAEWVSVCVGSNVHTRLAMYHALSQV